MIWRKSHAVARPAMLVFARESVVVCVLRCWRVQVQVQVVLQDAGNDLHYRPAAAQSVIPAKIRMSKLELGAAGSEC